MQSSRQSPTSTFRTILLIAIITLVVAVLPARAQNATPPPNTVGPTTRQVIPAFASRLAHAAAHAKPRSTPPTRKHASMCAKSRPGSPQGNQIAYENGPVNGQDLGWTINFGFSISESMQVNTTITGMQFWAWLIPGDTLTSVEVQMGAAAFGNELFDQTLNFTASNCFSNQFGYNVCLESANFTGPALSGNAWLTLSNASVPSGDPAYWDMNNGVGCASPGCPSQAQENTIGTIPSEAFTVFGNVTTSTEPPPPPPPPPCFQADNELKIIHDFTPAEGGPGGVTSDKAGNLYGDSSGGDYGFGMVYKMAPKEDNWLFTPIYSFLGGDNGSGPSPLIVGPEGVLYGTAASGVDNCGWNGHADCGLIFRLRPSPVTCPSAFCSWKEDVLYRFTGTGDGGEPSALSVDQAGNLYGIAFGGVVFELSPSPGGWTESTIYTFTDYPSSILAGNDGNLYGTTLYGGQWDEGTVFQLVPSGGGWTENILYSFQDSVNDGWEPANLHQDSSGNLYGTSYHNVDCDDGYGMTFQLLRSNGGWVFSAGGLNGGPNFTDIDNFTADAAGNTYFTYTHYRYDYFWGMLYQWSAIGGGVGWFTTDWFNPKGPLAVDPKHLYGITPDCGANQRGTLWSLPRQ